jgi:hypothetical protein
MNQEEAYMASPTCGDINILPQVEILIVLKHKYAYLSDVCIKINGKYVVKNGEASKDYVIVRSYKKNDFIRFGIRHKNGLPEESIMVQAWCSTECRTINEIFFVKGAHSTIGIKEFNSKLRVNKCNSGYVLSNEVVFESGMEFDINQHEVRMFNAKKNIIDRAMVPEKFMDDYISYYACANGEDWSFLISGKKDSLMIRSDLRVGKLYEFPMTDIHINNQWVQGRNPKNGQTYHLPYKYIPGKLDNFWFKMQFDEHEQYPYCKLWGKTQAWFNLNEIIVRYDCDPVLNEFSDILWTALDIGVPRIKSVKIISNSSMIVNDSFLVDFINPNVCKI